MHQGRRDGSTADHVYAWACAAIASGRLATGVHHSVHQLADELGASRTPVREAILRLAGLGIVTIERNRGFIVHPVTVEDVRENYEARMLIEVPAASAAARNCDTALEQTLFQHIEDMDQYIAEGNIVAFRERDRSFHHEIVRATGNERIQRMSVHLRDSSIRTWGLLTIGRTNFRARAWQQHARIANAIMNGQPDEAARAMHEHLENSALGFMRQVAAKNNEPEPETFHGRLSRGMAFTSVIPSEPIDVASVAAAVLEAVDGVSNESLVQE